jgi:hypothetical protein
VTASGWRNEPGADRGDARSRYRQCGDRALVDAMRSLDADALEEFIERFQHLVLLQARRLGIRREERKAWVAELLYDVARTLCRQRQGSAPGTLATYLITAGRRKAFARKRDAAVRERTDTGLMGELGGAGETALLTTCSEDAVRCTYGPAWEPMGLLPVLERLVSVFEEGISTDERMLLGWVGQRTPYSLIATWLGLSRSGAIKRVTRLRARLVDAAMRFGDSLDRDDRIELRRFLRRSGSFSDSELAGLTEAGAAFRLGETNTAGERGTDAEESERDRER